MKRFWKPFACKWGKAMCELHFEHFHWRKTHQQYGLVQWLPLAAAHCTLVGLHFLVKRQLVMPVHEPHSPLSWPSNQAPGIFCYIGSFYTQWYMVFNMSTSAALSARRRGLFVSPSRRLIFQTPSHQDPEASPEHMQQAPLQVWVQLHNQLKHCGLISA